MERELKGRILRFSVPGLACLASLVQVAFAVAAAAPAGREGGRQVLRMPALGITTGYGRREGRPGDMLTCWVHVVSSGAVRDVKHQVAQAVPDGFRLLSVSKGGRRRLGQ